MQKQKSKQVESDQEEQEEEILEQYYNEVDKLQTLGINVSDIQKLKNAGFCTVLSVLQATKKELMNIKGITEGKLEKIQTSASELEKDKIGFKSATNVLEKRKNIIRLTTGSEKLNELLGGGIESQSITEVFGEFRTGKTQLCHTLCVTAQLDRNSGGGAGKVAYIDTEGSFRPERIQAIAERFGLDPESVLENIAVARAYTYEHLSQLLVLIAAKMVEDNYCLLIIDSIMSLFRVDFSGRGELSERQQQLNKFLSRLIKIGEQFNLIVFVTNQGEIIKLNIMLVMSDPAGSAMAFADTRKPIGGNILAHASTTRLYLRKGRAEQRVCKIYDSPSLPESEAIFAIHDSGIIDAVD